MANDTILLSDDGSNGSGGYYSSEGLSPEYGICDGPHIEILEQPGDFRYRYEKERYHGHILSVNSPNTKKKDMFVFPKIKVHNYHDDVIVRCWLISANLSSKPQAHFHKLARKLPKGDMQLEPHDFLATHRNDYEVTFDYLHIVHAVMSDTNDMELYLDKKTWLESGLFDRPKYRDVSEASKVFYKNIDKNLSVLYIEAYDAQTKAKICSDAVSRKIKNLHNAETSLLKIVNYSKTYGSCRGGDEVFVFVEKISKDVEIRFFEQEKTTGIRIWQDNAEFGPQNVHHQYGIVFRTPKFRDVTSDVTVQFELHRKTDGATSPPVKFTYKPDETCRRDYQRKRPYSPENNFLTITNVPLLSNNDPQIKKLKETPVLIMSPDSTAQFILDSEFPKFDDLLDPPRSSYSNSSSSPPLFDAPISFVPSGGDADYLSNEAFSDYTDCFFSLDTIIPGDVQTDGIKPVKSKHDNAKPDSGDNVEFHTGEAEMGYVYKSPSTGDDKPKNKAPSNIKVLLDKFGFKSVDDVDSDGNSILLIGALYSINIVKLCLKYTNIDRDIKNLFGDNALLASTRKNNVEIVKLLLQEGFDPNETNYRTGETALHVAVLNGNYKLVALLLQHGGDPLAESFSSLSPYDYSVDCSNNQVRQLIYVKAQQMFLERRGTENGDSNDLVKGLQSLKV